MISEFVASNDLSVIEQITSGHRCGHIYRVRNRSGQLLVLKAAEDVEGKEEIRRNLEGYKKLKILGLDYFIPYIVSSSVSEEGGHILMEDCGNDLAALLRGGQIDPSTYNSFESELLKIYAKSLRDGIDPSGHINFQIETAKNLYRDFFKAHFGSSELNGAVETLHSLMPQQTTRFCFASWDFMPGNIFFSGVGMKFADPTESVTGIPIIDLACFSGSLGDVYRYAGAKEWYENLKKFSLGPVAEMLCLSRKEAEQIYLLGRLVQTLLSLRATIQQDSANKTVFVGRTEKYIKQLLFLKG